MKAYVLKNIADISFEEAPEPVFDGKGIDGAASFASVKDDDCVIVKVRAAGICGSDIPRIYKTGAYHHPMIPGHEFSGEITAIGGNVPKEALGKRAGIFPLIPCGECTPCKSGKYEMCRHYNYLGSRCNGGFAEFVKVPFWNIVYLPDEVSFEQAAMLEPLSVSLHAIRRSGIETRADKIDRDLPIAVCGMGTIGLFTVMHLRGLGYKNILCMGNKDHQKKALLELGVDESSYLDIRSGDAVSFIREKTCGEGAEFFFECVGRNEVISTGLNSLAPSGHLQLVGNPASDMTLGKDEYWKILRQQFTVTGTWNSSFSHSPDDDWTAVLDALRSGMISPEKLISHRLSLPDLEKGFEIMRDKKEGYIKVMCLM